MLWPQNPVWIWTTSMLLSVGMMLSSLGSWHGTGCFGFWPCPSSGGDGGGVWGDKADGCSLADVRSNKGSFSFVSSKGCDNCLSNSREVSLLLGFSRPAVARAAGCDPGGRLVMFVDMMAFSKGSSAGSPASSLSGPLSGRLSAELPTVDKVMEALSGRKATNGTCWQSKWTKIFYIKSHPKCLKKLPQTIGYLTLHLFPHSSLVRKHIYIHSERKGISFCVTLCIYIYIYIFFQGHCCL